MKKVLVLLILVLSLDVFAENRLVSIGINDSFRSEVLNEDRPLQIYTPKSYNSKGIKKYPVIYVLDGDSHFEHTVGIIDFLARQNRMPESILVSVPNTDRRYNLTPKPKTPEKYYPTAGGADQFIAFINKELIPYIESNYKANQHRTLIGHSIAGMFTVHTLMSSPETFSNYIAISPSLWWDNNFLVKKIDLFLKQHPLIQKRLYITIGNESGGHIGNRFFTSVRDFSAVLGRKAPKTFFWKFKHMPDETHGSIPHRTIYDGFEFIYDGWDFGDIYTLLRNEDIESIDNHFEQLSNRFGFEIETPNAVIDRFGHRFIRNKRFNRAINMYQRYIKNEPNAAYGYDRLSAAYLAQGDVSAALKSQNKAVELAKNQHDPQLSEYIENLKQLGVK